MTPLPLVAKLPAIGTAARPLRPSSLDKLIKCAVWYSMMIDEEDEGGPAAQTGSLVHAAVAAFHQTKGEAERIKAAVDALGINGPKFPLADPHEAKLYLTPYLSDPRNVNAEVVAVEFPVQLQLAPHPLDPTGMPIVIRGTLDQIRKQDGKYVVCDLKTGQRTGFAMIHEYAYQQAAYVLAARQTGFPDAEPGYIIRCYGYRARGAKLPSPDGVNWWMPMTVDVCYSLMERVKLAVAMTRGGYVEYGPGDWCTYCNFKGLDGCVPVANRRLFGG